MNSLLEAGLASLPQQPVASRRGKGLRPSRRNATRPERRHRCVVFSLGIQRGALVSRGGTPRKETFAHRFPPTRTRPVRRHRRRPRRHRRGCRYRFRAASSRGPPLPLQQSAAPREAPLALDPAGRAAPPLPRPPTRPIPWRSRRPRVRVRRPLSGSAAPQNSKEHGRPTESGERHCRREDPSNIHLRAALMRVLKCEGLQGSRRLPRRLLVGTKWRFRRRRVAGVMHVRTTHADRSRLVANVKGLQRTTTCRVGCRALMGRACRPRDKEPGANARSDEPRRSHRPPETATEPVVRRLSRTLLADPGRRATVSQKTGFMSRVMDIVAVLR